MESYKSPVARLYMADAMALMKGKKDDSIPLIITDPPYPSLEKHRARGTTTRLSHSKGSKMDWFPIVSNEYLAKWFVEAFRILKPARHCYVMANYDQMFVMRSLGRKAGFIFRKPIIWNKVAIGMSPWYRCQYEVVCLFTKPGKPAFLPRDLSIGDFLCFNRKGDIVTADEDGWIETVTTKRLKGKIPAVFPTEKPSGLMELLVRQSSVKGETVLDPFLGGGASTAVAAVKNDRKFLGSEIYKPYFKAAVKRIKSAECEFDKGTPDEEEAA